MFSSYQYRFSDENNKINKNDMKDIIPLSEMDALLFGDYYFSDTVKYATLVERSYGEPIMTHIFDESEIEINEMNDILRSMHSAEATVFFFWDIGSAVKTKWSLLIKYWNNFCWSGDDAIIYIDQNSVYLYTDMILRKINIIKKAPITTSDDFLQALGDSRARRTLSLEGLIKDFPDETQNRLYRIFHTISESAKTTNDLNDFPDKYLEYIFNTVHLIRVNLICVCKPYSSDSIKDIDGFLSREIESIESMSNDFFDLLKERIRSSREGHW